MKQFERIKITEEQVRKILFLEEDHFNDLKGKRIQPAKLSETISSFANTSGGEIYLGIEERVNSGEISRVWDGFRNIEEVNGHIQMLDSLSPLSNHYSVTFLEHPRLTSLVLQITVSKSTDIIKATNGIPYIRRGAQKLPIDTPEKLRRLELDKGIISFEDESVKTEITDITNSETIIRFLIDVIPSSEPEPWLKKQKLIIDNNPSVAGILLFSDEPQISLPKRSAIKIYRYKTAGEGDRDTLAFDPITIEGCIYNQIYSAVRRTKEIIEEIKKIGHNQLENIEYPDETLHEIITNAVLHRDYSIVSDVHIRVFDNRIEVENPGILPGHITVKNILNEQAARNPKLVRLINKFPDPPNKDVGEGLNTAFDAMQRLKLKPPVIYEKENSVLVIIKHEQLASPEEMVLEYLKVHDEIINREARKITGIKSENTMKRVFLRLKDQGILEPVPEKKGSASAWRLVKNR